MIGALVGGLVGGCIGAGMRSPKVVVRERVKEQWHDIDYDRLAKKVIDNLKQERIQAINDRKTELLQMEEGRKYACANCGKEIVCVKAKIFHSCDEYDEYKVEFVFGCDCKTETIKNTYYRWGYEESDIFDHSATSIIIHNAGSCLSCEYVVNHNKEAFSAIFNEAYALWKKQSDLDEENGKSPYAVEIERLNAMLNDPLGLAEGLGIGTSASNGSTLMLAVDKE